jgi:hypothetical protein
LAPIGIKRTARRAMTLKTKGAKKARTARFRAAEQGSG